MYFLAGTGGLPLLSLGLLELKLGGGSMVSSASLATPSTFSWTITDGLLKPSMVLPPALSVIFKWGKTVAKRLKVLEVSGVFSGLLGFKMMGLTKHFRRTAEILCNMADAAWLCSCSNSL